MCKFNCFGGQILHFVQNDKERVNFEVKMKDLETVYNAHPSEE
jgi:hypothetical protein